MGFKPKDDTAARLSQQQETMFDQEQFVTDVMNGDYLLVVGSEVIMNRDEEPSGDVKQYLLKALNSSLNRNYKDLNELALDSGSGVDPVRNLLNSADDFSYDLADMSPELRDMIGTRLFPIVLTTTFDGYLETLMRSIWGERLRVVSIDDKRSLDDLRNSLATYRDGSRYSEPTLIYIFGKAEKDESRHYVRTDNDAIQIIEKWLFFGNDALMKFIRSKKVLALGCKFEDWYFRFFWYILKHDFSRFREGQVAFTLDKDSDSDRGLNSFLERNRIYSHGDATAFMHSITESLTSTDPSNPFCEQIVRSRREGGVFLSYCSHDRVMATQLFFRLRAAGFDVWFDNSSLKGGDNYDAMIQDAIGRCRVFLPLLTPYIAEDLTAGRTDNYYNREWRMASQLGNKAIIPVAANGYGLTAPYHTSTFEQITGQPLSGVDLMTPDGFSKLIKSIASNLG